MRVIHFLVLLLIPLGFAVAEILEITPVQDAYICNCKPDSTNPNGGSDYLYHGQYGSCFDRTLIQWDISCVPSGATVVNATMFLYCEAFYGTSTGNPVYYMLDGPWDELTVTFNNQPGYTATQVITGDWPCGSTWYQLDITDFVEKWLAGSHDNYGIYCFCSGTTSTCVPGFWSKDYSDESLRPYLRVEYYPAGMDLDTWGAIKRVRD